MEHQNKDLDFKNIQDQLLVERRTRMTIMSVLLSALLFTVIYGTLYSPFTHTFSKIGNRFTPSLRIVFIIWSSYTGFAIQSSIIALFRLENYQKKSAYILIAIGVVFLILTAITPALPDLPFWLWVHRITSVIFALCMTVGFYPYLRWISEENPRLRLYILIWFIAIWGGSISLMLLFGNTGVFELFFFASLIIFLLYLSMTLFEEQIIKRSVKLLKDKEDLNQGIEDILKPRYLREKEGHKKTLETTEALQIKEKI